MAEFPDGIFFNPRIEKVENAVALVAGISGGIPIRLLDLVFYLSDREHLNRYGRPVLGLPYGREEDHPYSKEVRSMSALAATAESPWDFNGSLFVRNDVGIDMDVFSRSDIDTLGKTTLLVMGGSRPETPAGWADRLVGGWVCYSSMMDAHPDLDERLDDLAYVAPLVSL